MNYEHKYKKYKIKYLELKRDLDNSSLRVGIPSTQPSLKKNPALPASPPSPPSSPSSQGDDNSENSSVLSIEELSDPNIIIVSSILFEIHELIESVPKEYNIRTFLEKEMLKYLKTSSLLRPPTLLIKLAKLKCTQDKIKDTFTRLLTQKQVTDNDGDLDGLVLLQSKAHSVATGLAGVLLEGIDLSMFENYLWDRPIPTGLSIYQRQQYILDNHLRITGVSEQEKDRTSQECLHIQEAIVMATHEFFTDKLNNLDALLASKEDKNSLSYCIKIANATAGVPKSFFREGTKYYNLIGYNPNDRNVSRDNSNPDAESFAFAGLIKHPNDFFRRNQGMNYIKNINTGKPINSNCFNLLRYHPYEFPLSKKVNEFGKYISKSKL